MALMSLTMLLIAILVMVTIGVGARAKEKIETQTLTDSAAYSSAVLTARAYNSAALLNRVIVADMVSALSTNALVNYASHYRAMVYAIQLIASDTSMYYTTASPTTTCTLAYATAWAQIASYTVPELARLDKIWAQYDMTFTNTRSHIAAVVAAAQAAAAEQSALLSANGLLDTELKRMSIQIAKKATAANAAAQAEFSAPQEPILLSETEVLTGLGAGVSSETGVMAAMGSRLYPIQLAESNLTGPIQANLINNLGIKTITVVNESGSSGYVQTNMGGQLGGATPGTDGILSDALKAKIKVTTAVSGCGTSPTASAASAGAGTGAPARTCIRLRSTTARRLPSTSSTGGATSVGRDS